MKWSFTIARIAGIDVRIHMTFFLLLLWIAFSYWQQTHDFNQVVSGVGFIISLFVCVVLHEFGHALTARHYGVVTRNITLLPIGGVASMESMPKNPRHEIAVALAGPLVNFAIAGILLLLLPSGTLVTNPESLGGDETVTLGGGSFAENLLYINLLLGIFNLLPAFPMDGGRVLRAVLNLFMPSTRATRTAASIGQGFAIALGLLGLLGNPFLILIALFVWIGAAGEASYAQLKSAISHVPVTRAMLTDYETVLESDSLGHLVTLTLKGSQKDFPVARNDEIVGVLTQSDLLRGLRESGELGVVSRYMSQDVARARANEGLEDVVERLRSSTCKLVAVVDGGKTIGIVNYDNLIELVAMNTAMHKDLDESG
jgi:Zn-dependent protease/predicted transcriptional regulator